MTGVLAFLAALSAGSLVMAAAVANGVAMVRLAPARRVLGRRAAASGGHAAWSVLPPPGPTARLRVGSAWVGVAVRRPAFGPPAAWFHLGFPPPRDAAGLPGILMPAGRGWVYRETLPEGGVDDAWLGDRLAALATGGSEEGVTAAGPAPRGDGRG